MIRIEFCNYWIYWCESAHSLQRCNVQCDWTILHHYTTVCHITNVTVLSDNNGPISEFYNMLLPQVNVLIQCKYLAEYSASIWSWLPTIQFRPNSKKWSSAYLYYLPIPPPDPVCEHSTAWACHHLWSLQSSNVLSSIPAKTSVLYFASTSVLKFCRLLFA